MKLNPKEIKQRAEAAMVLLNEGTTSLEKVQSIVGLLKGVNKKLDGVLAVCEKNCRAIELASQGAVVELAVEHMPEETEEQKKRKKVLLLFIRSWGDLRNEVSRIQAELEAGKQVTDSSFWLSALSAAKGPLAIVTIIAIGVGVMSQTSVDVVIENHGCPTLYASGAGIALPGLVLPSEPIVSGGSATLTIPPVPLSVDGTSGTSLELSMLGLSYSIELSQAVSDVTFNGGSLLGTVTEIDLSEAGRHALRLSCGG